MVFNGHGTIDCGRQYFDEVLQSTPGSASYFTLRPDEIWPEKRKDHPSERDPKNHLSRTRGHEEDDQRRLTLIHTRYNCDPFTCSWHLRPCPRYALALAIGRGGRRRRWQRRRWPRRRRRIRRTPIPPPRLDVLARGRQQGDRRIHASGSSVPFPLRKKISMNFDASCTRGPTFKDIIHFLSKNCCSDIEAIGVIGKP